MCTQQEKVQCNYNRVIECYRLHRIDKETLQEESIYATGPNSRTSAKDLLYDCHKDQYGRGMGEIDSEAGWHAFLHKEHAVKAIEESLPWGARHDFLLDLWVTKKHYYVVRPMEVPTCTYCVLALADSRTKGGTVPTIRAISLRFATNYKHTLDSFEEVM